MTKEFTIPKNHVAVAVQEGANVIVGNVLRNVRDSLQVLIAMEPYPWRRSGLRAAVRLLDQYIAANQEPRR